MGQTKTTQAAIQTQDSIEDIPENVDAFLKMLARWVADDMQYNRKPTQGQQ
jgi:hypothetical protein